MPEEENTEEVMETPEGDPRVKPEEDNIEPEGDNGELEESKEEGFAKLEGFGDVMVEVAVELGKTYMPIQQFLKLGRGAIVELDHPKEEDLAIYANDRIIAKGEINVVEEVVNVVVTEVAIT